MIADMQSRLRGGGPEVHFPVLCAYVAGTLEEGERRVVAGYVATWRAWFEEHLLLLDADEPRDGEGDPSAGPTVR